MIQESVSGFIELAIIMALGFGLNRLLTSRLRRRRAQKSAENKDCPKPTEDRQVRAPVILDAGMYEVLRKMEILRMRVFNLHVQLEKCLCVGYFATDVRVFQENVYFLDEISRTQLLALSEEPMLAARYIRIEMSSHWTLLESIDEGFPKYSWESYAVVLSRRIHLRKNFVTCAETLESERVFLESRLKNIEIFLESVERKVRDFEARLFIGQLAKRVDARKIARSTKKGNVLEIEASPSCEGIQDDENE